MRLIFLPTKLPRFQVRMILLSAFSFCALSLFITILYTQRKNSITNNFLIEQNNAVISKTEKLKTLLAQSESASRAYMIGAENNLQDLLVKTHQQIKADLIILEKETAGHPNQSTTIATLQKLVGQKIALQQQLIHKKYSTDSIAIASSKELSLGAEINAAIEILIAHEKQLIQQRINDNDSIYRRSIYIATTFGILAFLLVVAILIRLNRDIRWRKRAERQSLISERKYLNLIENAGVVIYTTDAKGNITFANGRAAALTGYTIQELIGMNFSQLVAKHWIDQVVNNYVHQFQQKLVETTIELQIITKDGKTKWVEQSAVMLLDNNGTWLTGFQCMAKDISEKKAIQLALEKSSAELKENQYRLQSILDNTNSLIFIKDLNGRYVTVNKRFKEVVQVTDEMVIGKTDFDINTTEQATIYSETDKQVIETKQPFESVEILTKNDLELTIFKTKFPLLDHNNKVFGIGGIATDITERSNNHKQLIIAKQEAEEAKKMQEQFLANMSHEIRTPINGIQGMTNLLLETSLNEQQSEFANIIKRSVNNLLVIINDILDFSKIKSGKLTIEKIDFQLEEIVQNAKAIFAHRLKKKGLQLNVIVDENVPTVLSGDPYRLNQILINLLGNAIKFTEHGGVEILVKLRNQTTNQIEVFFSVTDTGIGIPEDKLADIFESFTQASYDTTRRYGGTGLGLAISKQLVELQNGHIYVNSTEGKGSVFSFYIPYGYSQHPQKTQPVVHASESDFKDALQNKQFLVVEDNEVNQKLITYVLDKIGGIITIANNGKEAIDLLAINSYDIIIMDLQMPVLDGYEATKHIRQVMQLKTPIIAMTATAIKGEQVKCLEIGMNDYMSKPFEFNDLYRRLVKLTERRKEDSVEDTSFLEKPYDLRTLEEMNDVKIMIAVIDMFLKNIPEELQLLEQYIALMHWQKAYETAHKLKSSATTLEAYDFASILGKIEMNTQTGIPQENNADLLAEALHSFKVIQQFLEQERATIFATIGNQIENAVAP